jgi:hypothetical protein
MSDSDFVEALTEGLRPSERHVTMPEAAWRAALDVIARQSNELRALTTDRNEWRFGAIFTSVCNLILLGLVLWLALS